MAVISGGVVIMAVLVITLHCRRLRVRTKELGYKATQSEDNFTEQEIWPASKPGEIATESKVSFCLEKFI